MNGVAGLIFYLIAARALAIGPALVLGLSIFLVHAAIGSLNDFLDVDLDRRSRPDKPLVRGDLSPGGAFARLGRRPRLAACCFRSSSGCR